MLNNSTFSLLAAVSVLGGVSCDSFHWILGSPEVGQCLASFQLSLTPASLWVLNVP